MPLSAITKVQLAVKAVLEAQVPTVQWFVDRSDEQGFEPEELPGALIRVLDVALSPEHDQLGWLATLMIDFQSGGEAGLTIDAVNQQNISDTIAALWASELLGGMVQTLDPVSIDSSEQSAPDVGWAVLRYSIEWFTPNADPYSIIGISAQIF